MSSMTVKLSVGFQKSSRYLKKDNKLTIEGKIAENFYEINVFVKKNNGENFYYLGDVEKVLSAKEIRIVKGNLWLNIFLS